MGFKKEVTELDLGLTSIENMFINDFMPMGSGTSVKVYLYGYKCACDQDNEINVDNRVISNQLNIPIDDVLRAWDFWENLKIIKKHHNSEKTGDYDVEFLSLRQLFINENLSAKPDVKNAEDTPSTKNEFFLEANRSPIIKDMFSHLDTIIRRPLQYNERMLVLEWVYEYNFDPDVIMEAFTLTSDEPKKRNLKYITGIIMNWYSLGIVSKDKLDEHYEEANIYYRHYKTIYSILGFSNKSPSKGAIEIMDIWLKDWALPMDFLEKVIIDLSKKTPNINMNYLHKGITALYEKSIRTLESYLVYLTTSKQQDQKANAKGTTQSKSTQNKYPKNKFHNFENKGNEYSNEELEKILGIKK